MPMTRASRCDRGVGARFGRLCQVFQPLLLDPLDLLANEPPPFQVPLHLVERIGRDRPAFERVQFDQRVSRFF